MKEYKIYTAGKMGGLSFEHQMDWRWAIEQLIQRQIDQPIQVQFIHPPLFYTYGKDYHKTEREVKQFDIDHICSCDIVIVNLDEIESSIGTHYELAAIDAHNQSGKKFIYVIAVGDMKDDLHPWIKDSIFRHEEDLQAAANYIASYLLI